MTTILWILLMSVVENDAYRKDMKICYNKSDKYFDTKITKVIDVPFGWSIQLECHYCLDQDDYQAKVWFFRKRGNLSNKKELTASADSDVKTPIDISPAHTLRIKHFNMYNSGIYLCSYFGHDEAIFTYILDGVYDVKTTPMVGAVKDWYEFKKNVLDPTNNLIQHSKGPRIFPFKIGFSWGKWGLCKSNGDKYVRQRTGKCRIYPMHCKILEMISSAEFDNDLIAYLLDSYIVSCRSVELNTIYPEISRVLRNIPEFIIRESCNTFKTGNKMKKDKVDDSFKYNVTRNVEENGHLILSCPEVFVKSEINWYKNNCLLNSTFRNNMARSIIEPHLTIDEYNSLHILRAEKADEGIYACNVDDRNMQTFYVKVVTKHKLLNQDFIRYSIYLGFVLSLTMTCYCAGICVAWQKRASFLDPFILTNNM